DSRGIPKPVPRQQPLHDRRRADVGLREATQGPRDLVLPVEKPERAFGDRRRVAELCGEKASSRDRADAAQAREQSELVQTPRGAQGKQKRAITASRQAQGHPLPRRLRRRYVLLQGVMRRRRRLFLSRHRFARRALQKSDQYTGRRSWAPAAATSERKSEAS